MTYILQYIIYIYYIFYMQTSAWKSLPESFSNIWLGLFYRVVLSIKGCLEVSTVVVTLYVILSGK